MGLGQPVGNDDEVYTPAVSGRDEGLPHPAPSLNMICDFPLHSSLLAAVFRVRDRRDVCVDFFPDFGFGLEVTPSQPVVSQTLMFGATSLMLAGWPCDKRRMFPSCDRVVGWYMGRNMNWRGESESGPNVRTRLWSKKQPKERLGPNPAIQMGESELVHRCKGSIGVLRIQGC